MLKKIVLSPAPVLLLTIKRDFKLFTCCDITPYFSSTSRRRKLQKCLLKVKQNEFRGWNSTQLLQAARKWRVLFCPRHCGPVNMAKWCSGTLAWLVCWELQKWQSGPSSGFLRDQKIKRISRNFWKNMSRHEEKRHWNKKKNWPCYVPNYLIAPSRSCRVDPVGKVIFRSQHDYLLIIKN